MDLCQFRLALYLLCAHASAAYCNVTLNGVLGYTKSFVIMRNAISDIQCFGQASRTCANFGSLGLRSVSRIFYDLDCEHFI